MKVLWIIGNGFDLNLGLDTGYRSFLDRAYSRDETEAERRGKLEGIVGAELSDPQSNRWSDLEMLLADATEGYPPESDDFDYTFEGIQRLFVDYVASEERRIPDAFEDAVIEEFWDTITHFHRRLTERDRSRLLMSDPGQESIEYLFMTLNYTRVFDRLLDHAEHCRMM